MIAKIIFVACLLAASVTAASDMVTRVGIVCPDEMPVRRWVLCEVHLRNATAEPETDVPANWDFNVTLLPQNTGITRITPLVDDERLRTGVFQFSFWPLTVGYYNIFVTGPAPVNNLTTSFQTIVHDRVVPCYSSSLGGLSVRQMRWSDAAGHTEKVALSGPKSRYFVDATQTYVNNKDKFLQSTGVVGRAVPEPVVLNSLKLQGINQATYETCDMFGRTDATNSDV